MKQFTTLTAIDVVFETTGGFSLTVLSASHNVIANFLHCVFIKISGFRISHKGNVYINSSRISGCINTLQLKALIEVLDESHLHISNSNITDNSVLETSSMISLQVMSTLLLSHCLYQGNSMASHLVAADNTTVIITSCTFINNTVAEIL